MIKSVYKPNTKFEEKRLLLQSQECFNEDMQILDPILNNKKNLTILDAGCGFGYVTASRFKKSHCSFVLGLDKCQSCIDFANLKFANSTYAFEQIDFEAEAFEENLKAILRQYKIKKFDIIFSALTLHHLKNPQAVLAVLKKYLKSNGVIVLRGSDDGSKVCSSTSNNLEQILDMTCNVQGASDRKNGRKLFAWLNDANFKNIQIKTIMKETSNFSLERKNFLMSVFHIE